MRVLSYNVYIYSTPDITSFVNILNCLFKIILNCFRYSRCQLLNAQEGIQIFKTILGSIEKKWLTPLISTYFRHQPVPASGCILSTAEHISHAGSTNSLLFFRPSSGSETGTLLRGKDGLWLPEQVCLAACCHSSLCHRTRVFFCVILCKGSPPFGLQQSGCQEDEGVNQTLRTQMMVWGSGFYSPNAPSLSA